MSEQETYTAALFGGSFHGQTRQIQGAVDQLHLPVRANLRSPLVERRSTETPHPSADHVFQEVYRRVSGPIDGQVDYEYERTTT